MKTFVILACLAISSAASAEWRGNGEDAAGYNPRTGTAWTAQKNDNGVTTTQTSRGGKAKTKNGKGVYRAPNGKKCVKTANGQGCQ